MNYISTFNQSNSFAPTRKIHHISAAKISNNNTVINSIPKSSYSLTPSNTDSQTIMTKLDENNIKINQNKQPLSTQTKQQQVSPHHIQRLASICTIFMKQHWPSLNSSSKSTVFHSYVVAILKKTEMSAPFVLVALMYLSRLKRMNPNYADSKSETKLFAIAMVLSNKTLDDHRFTNKTWASVTGIDLPSLNQKEREFLDCIEYCTHVSESKYNACATYLNSVFTKSQEQQNLQRNTPSSPLANINTGLNQPNAACSLPSPSSPTPQELYYSRKLNQQQSYQMEEDYYTNESITPISVKYSSNYDVRNMGTPSSDSDCSVTPTGNAIHSSFYH